MLWKWTADGECEICPSCGFTQHADWWFEEQFFQLVDGHEMKHDKIHKWQAAHIKSRPMMRSVASRKASE